MANPNGWISYEEKHNDLECLWGFKDVIRHKTLCLLFFRNEGFIFQEWLIYQGIFKFVEIEGDYYPNLVKVFYANIKVEIDIIHSRVKSVNIHIDDVVSKTVVGFHPEGFKSHLDIPGVNKMAIYNDCLRFPKMPYDFTLFKVGGLKKNVCLCAFIIAWILLPMGGNHA